MDEGLPQGAEKAIPIYETEYKSKENCICSINGNLLGTGFFCKVKIDTSFNYKLSCSKWWFHESKSKANFLYKKY